MNGFALQMQQGLIRIFVWLLLLAVQLGGFNGTAWAQKQMRPEVEALLEIYASDYKSPEVYPQALAALTSRPDIKADLLAAMQRDYFQGQSGTNPRVDRFALSALTLRSDLTADEQKIFTDELERLLPEKEVSRFVGPALRFLSHYPSAEHESLVLRYLKRPDLEAYLVSTIFQTLAAIGGKDSLEAMRQLAEQKRRAYPNYWVLPELDRCIGSLQQKLNQKAGDIKSAAQSPQPTEQAHFSSLKSKPANQKTSEPDSGSWWGIGVLAVGTILALAFACRFFKSSK